jgi:dihydropteroate synthase
MASQKSNKIWNCRGRTITFGSPLVMGILNVTPDSFYAESRLPSLSDALARAQTFWQTGATLIDVGAESTRPGAMPLTPEAECERLIPVLKALRDALPEAILSADTRHTLTAKAALEVGVDVINDVSGCAPDEGMLQVIAASGAGYILTHATGVATVNEPLTDVTHCTKTVITDLLAAAQVAQREGVSPAQIMLDPGLGFGKSAAVSQRLLADTAQFAALPYPLLVGASRKRFLGDLTGQADATQRGAASIGAALLAVAAGADVVRVHDVRETIDALKVFSLLNSNKDNANV